MKSVNLDVSERTEQGTAACRRMRKQGIIPMNLYGLGRPVRQLQSTERAMRTLIERGVHIVNLTIQDKTQAALIKEVQYDAVGSWVVHADLMRVDPKTPVQVYVPIRFVGTAPEVSGSMVDKIREDVHVECLPLEIPDEFTINLSKLQVGESVTIGDLKFPEGCLPYEHNAEDVIVINHVKVEREEPEAGEGEGEEAAEPELIGRKKVDEED
ncbi:MAG: 50S ribosomal protein L25 [Planctomycetes bacterium]|nr:50S ribosomal protein L25 [Planctomycetota bacterium]